MMKIGHHPWMKARKYEKTFIIHEWKWENAENRSSSTDEKEKEAEKRSSATAESEKTTKIGFRPWPMSKKQQKQRFGRGRKLQNGKSWLSAAAETPLSANFNAWQRAIQPWNCFWKLQLSFYKAAPIYSKKSFKSSGKYLYMSGKNANIATENGQRTLVRSPTALSTERNIFGKWNR